MKQRIIYLCAVQEDAAAALCSSAALSYLAEILRGLGYGVVCGSADSAQCNACKPDVALQLATSFGGLGCVVYHPVCADWQRYGDSCQLATLLETQARRYRLLCRRPIQAGTKISWLHEVQAVAVQAVCNLPDGDLTAHLPLIQAQMGGYGQAIKLYLDKRETKGESHET